MQCKLKTPKKKKKKTYDDMLAIKIKKVYVLGCMKKMHEAQPKAFQKLPILSRVYHHSPSMGEETPLSWTYTFFYRNVLLLSLSGVVSFLDTLDLINNNELENDPFCHRDCTYEGQTLKKIIS
jgi:hypothetical protein